VPAALKWDSYWDTLECEMCETFNLGTVQSMAKAIGMLTEVFGCTAVDESGQAASSATSHTLYLSGLIFNAHPVLIRCRMASLSSGITSEVYVKSTCEQYCVAVIDAMN
jgi:hypothetical protein